MKPFHIYLYGSSPGRVHVTDRDSTDHASADPAIGAAGASPVSPMAVTGPNVSPTAVTGRNVSPSTVTGPLETSFELASQRLERLAGVSFEPDGSFGFVATGGKERLFGMLYDAGERLQYVDLQAELSFDQWRKIVLAICGTEPLLASLWVLQLPAGTLKTFQQFEAETWGIL